MSGTDELLNELLNRVARGLLALGDEDALATPRIWSGLMELSDALIEAGMLPEPIVELDR